MAMTAGARNSAAQALSLARRRPVQGRTAPLAAPRRLRGERLVRLMVIAPWSRSLVGGPGGLELGCCRLQGRACVSPVAHVSEGPADDLLELDKAHRRQARDGRGGRLVEHDVRRLSGLVRGEQVAGKVGRPVSYTHLTLPTNREV